MAYTIEINRNGVVKRFSGDVTPTDVLKSEKAVTEHPNYSSLRYVISDYIAANYHGLSDDARDDLYAIRIGGHILNPQIKYAFVVQDPLICADIKGAVDDGYMLHQTKMFDTFDEASDWAGL